MKRIALLVFGILLVTSGAADARGRRYSRNQTYYTRPATTATVAYRPVVNTPAATATNTPAQDAATSNPTSSETSEVATASATAALPTPAPVRTVNYSTATAQGVANLMAAYNRVGHFGGNPGYEGCGCGATPAAAYSICCYGNSGMATVDVGYAQGANGMWYCCRRYR